MEIRKIFKNYFYLIFSQFLTLLMNVIMVAVFPKILGVEEFGYWQLFLFYVAYVGFFHFGLNDGIYLRYGGRNFDKSNKEIIKSQFILLLLLQILIAIILFVAQFFFADHHQRLIIYFVIFYMVLNNTLSFMTSYFQSTNKLSYFSNVTIINTVIFLLIIGLLFLFHKIEYHYLIYAYVFSNIVSFSYALFVFRKYIFQKVNYSKIRMFLNEFKINIFVGFLLMISSISSMLILGIGRFIIEKKWGVAAFAVVSFALTITTFMIFFIRQISLVLFPLLKNTTKSKQRGFFQMSSKILDFILLALLMVIPLIQIFISTWLPKYLPSFVYFILVLPICVYEGKAQVIFITYMKVLRKEKQLLYINLIAMGASLIFSLLGYYLNNILFIIFCMTLAIMLRGILLEIYICEIYQKKYKQVFIPFLLCIIFIALFYYLKLYNALLIYFLLYTIFIIYNKEDILKIFDKYKNILQK